MKTQLKEIINSNYYLRVTYFYYLYYILLFILIYKYNIIEIYKFNTILNSYIINIFISKGK